MEISDIKAKLTLSEVIKHYGYKADKQNRINCPFHDDKTPSMQLYWKTHTAYCFSANCKTHGKNLDVIDFILHKENVTKHEAIKKAETMINGTPINTSNIGVISREQFLNKMFTYFKNAVHNSPQAKQYIQSRTLDYTKLEIGSPVDFYLLRPRFLCSKQVNLHKYFHIFYYLVHRQKHDVLIYFLPY
jgi:DNA primase